VPAKHWHGLFQHGTNYNDGAAFVTQCPIIPKNSYQYNFEVPDQVRVILLVVTFHWPRHMIGGNILVPLSCGDAILRWFEGPSGNIRPFGPSFQIVRRRRRSVLLLTAALTGFISSINRIYNHYSGGLVMMPTVWFNRCWPLPLQVSRTLITSSSTCHRGFYVDKRSRSLYGWSLITIVCRQRAIWKALSFPAGVHGMRFIFHILYWRT
jgi:hypothetical protein